MQTALAAAALVVFLTVGIAGAQLGWGTDRDSIRVVQAASAILAGHYQRSRSFGFPLHEAATAVLYRCGGLSGANLGSLAVTICGICAALRLAHHVAADRVGLAAVALCSAPLLLVDASAAIDFGWSFAAGMFLLLAALTVMRVASMATLSVLFATMMAALLLRPDNVLFVAAVAGAVVWTMGGPRWGIVAAFLAAAAVSAGIYVWLNGTHVLLTGVTTTRPLWARLARAVVCGTAALGPGGLVALAALAKPSGSAPEALMLRRTVCLSWLLYVPRFVALPDQADYLVLPVMGLLLLAACTLPWRLAVTCVALSALPAWMTVSVFRRDDQHGVLAFAVAAQSGAVAQDMAARRFAMDMARPDMAAFVVSRLGGPDAPKVLTYDTYMPGYVSPARDLVLGQAQLYRVLPGGNALANQATVPRRTYAAVWACDAALGPGIGWRGWEAPIPESAPAGLLCQLAAK